MATQLTDMIVVLPGIMGSTLSDSTGKPLWDPGYGMAPRLFGHKKWIQALVVNTPDRPDDTSFVGGIRPTGLVASKIIIPGLVRIGGYTELHAALSATFNLIEGDQHEPSKRLDGKQGPPPNYFRFAYDWRRDIRASAMQLKALIDVALPAWRRIRPSARVILVGHSMGGLVSRWYLEGVDPATGQRLDGWKSVRQLVTFGTPYRGAVKPLDFLVNGFKKGFVDFSEALQSFTGISQLLPRYKSVHDRRTGGTGWVYPKDLSGLSSFDSAKARDAYEHFYTTIDEGVLLHRHDPSYDDRFVTPLIGFGHATNNSAELTDDGMELSQDLPPDLPQNWVGGDGTVPYISGLPLDYDDWPDAPAWKKVVPVSYLNEKHGFLQTQAAALAAEIGNNLRRTQESGGAARSLPDTTAPELATDTLERPHISLDLPDYVMAGEAVKVAIRTTAVEHGAVALTVTELGTGVTTETAMLPNPVADVELRLPPGDYEITATRQLVVPGVGRLASRDLFSVIDAAATSDLT